MTSDPRLLPLPRLALPVQHPANADQVIFFAAHGNLSIADTRLLGHYSYQLSQAKRIAMWVLLYRPEVDGMDILPAESAAVGVPVAAWGDGTLRRGVPLVAAALRKDAGLHATPNANHQRYFWFHCSLRLWELSFGHAAPRPRFFWRVELDVLFAGVWPWLLQRASSSSADLLLPTLVRHDTPSGRIYPHWARNSAVLGASPRKDWVYGRVRQVQAASWESLACCSGACATRARCEKLRPQARVLALASTAHFAICHAGWSVLAATRRASSTRSPPSGTRGGWGTRRFRFPCCACSPPVKRAAPGRAAGTHGSVSPTAQLSTPGRSEPQSVAAYCCCRRGCAQVQLGHERCQLGAFHRLKTFSWRNDMMVL
jgi:hypothetical protein